MIWRLEIGAGEENEAGEEAKQALPRRRENKKANLLNKFSHFFSLCGLTKSFPMKFIRKVNRIQSGGGPQTFC